MVNFKKRLPETLPRDNNTGYSVFCVFRLEKTIANQTNVIYDIGQQAPDGNIYSPFKRYDPVLGKVPITSGWTITGWCELERGYVK